VSRSAISAFEAGLSQVGTAQVGAEQVDLASVGAGQLDALQQRTAKISFRQTAAGEIVAGKVREFEAGAPSANMARQKSRVQSRNRAKVVGADRPDVSAAKPDEWRPGLRLEGRHFGAPSHKCNVGRER
jgi:hypothetical protein